MSHQDDQQEALIERDQLYHVTLVSYAGAFLWRWRARRALRRYENGVRGSLEFYHLVEEGKEIKKLGLREYHIRRKIRNQEALSQKSTAIAAIAAIIAAFFGALNYFFN